MRVHQGMAVGCPEIPQFPVIHVPSSGREERRGEEGRLFGPPPVSTRPIPSFFGV